MKPDGFLQSRHIHQTNYRTKANSLKPSEDNEKQRSLYMGAQETHRVHNGPR